MKPLPAQCSHGRAAPLWPAGT